MKKRRNPFMNIKLGVTNEGAIVVTEGPQQIREIIEVIIPALLQMKPEERIKFFEEGQNNNPQTKNILSHNKNS